MLAALVVPPRRGAHVHGWRRVCFQLCAAYGSTCERRSRSGRRVSDIDIVGGGSFVFIRPAPFVVDNNNFGGSGIAAIRSSPFFMYNDNFGSGGFAVIRPGSLVIDNDNFGGGSFAVLFTGPFVIGLGRQTLGRCVMVVGGGELVKCGDRHDFERAGGLVAGGLVSRTVRRAHAVAAAIVG